MANALALCACPECGYPEAEIKKAKNGTAYRFCPDCSAQYFTQKKEKSDRLFKLGGLDSNGEPLQKQPVTETEQKPQQKPKESGFSFNNL